VGRRVKKLVRHIFLGRAFVGSIVAAMRTRGGWSSSAVASREARGCESWQWCDLEDD
jgi:hypothetical protein